MRLNIKKFTIKLSAGLLILSFIVGTVGALNGWFGGARKIPEDTFTRGLVAYWSFDEGSGNIAYDASGNGNHGTLINGPKWTQGKIGGALSFDGVNDYVDCGNNPSLDITDEITVEAWVYIPSGVDTNYERGIINRGAEGYWRMGIKWGNIRFHVWNTENILKSVSFAYTNDVWIHVVATVKANDKLRIYKNGQIMAETSFPGEMKSNPSLRVQIGNLGYGVSYIWNGLIDEVRIYNRALSEEEIRFHYSRGGPVGYWKFDEGSGNIAYDSSGNGNHGTLVNGPTWTSGKFGSALSFDGVDDYVRIPADLQFQTIHGPSTIELWFKANSLSGTKRIFSDNCFEWGIYHVDSTLYGKAYSTVNGGTISVGQWYHVVLTHEHPTGLTNTIIKIHVNGVLKGQTTWTLTTENGYTDKPYWIGGDGCLPGSEFNGLIDEVRIYNYALTPDEIRLNYNAGYAARFGPQTDCSKDPGSCMDYGLVGYWSFDEGSGNVAYDASGNGNHGTIYGAKWTSGAPCPTGASCGGGLSFDGVDDYVDCGNDPSLDLYEQVTVVFWMKEETYIPATWNNVIGKASSPFANWDNGSYVIRLLNYDMTSNMWFTDGSYSYFHYPLSWDGRWSHFAVVFYSNNYHALYHNGVLVRKNNVNKTMRRNDYSLWIGGFRFKNTIDEVRIYNRALSEEEIRYHYNYTRPKGALSPIAMKDDPSLVAYWSFNEGNGTIVNDQSGNNNNGTLYLGSSGNTDPAKAWSPGISGTALSFDGVDDYVRIPSSPSLAVGEKATFAFWLFRRGPGTRGSTDTILASRRNYWIWIDRTTRQIGFESAGSGGVWGPDVYSASSIEDGKWYHIVVVRTSSTRVKIYINGKFDVEGDTYPSEFAANPVFIGMWEGTIHPFNGLIDEVRIYNRALTEQEILEHYRNSKYYLASHFGPKTNCSEDPASCIDYGLVGYWSFDEGAGTTAYDASGNNNHGTIYGAKWTGGAPCPAGASCGGGLSFDGVDDYVEVPLSPSLNFTQPITISWWMAVRGNGGLGNWPGVLRMSPKFNIYMNRHINPDHPPLEPLARDSAGNNIWFWRYYDWVENEWFHVALTYDGSVANFYINGTLFGRNTISTTMQLPTESLKIGLNSTYFNGLIDEVRIYNRALSEEEIRYLYNRGAPVAHWKFDEGAGTTIYDSSGNGNNGTLYLGTSGNTSIPSAWVSGKHGSALSFDGVDDYVRVPHSSNLVFTNKFTFVGWIYPKDFSYDRNYGRRVFHKGDNPMIHLLVTYSFRFRLKIGGVTYDFSAPANSLTVNTWHHIAAVYDGSFVRLYVNGVKVLESARTGNLDTNTEDLFIGIHSSLTAGAFNGLIDDVRIYNYARTPEQILQDYNAGLSTHFK